MLQTIYEGDSCFSSDGISKSRLPQDPHNGDMHNINNSVDVKPEVPLALEPASPLDLRTDGRTLALGSDPSIWERQLQKELLLIQKQQQIQKQLLINEFQKQHENLVRQHEVQLQEHFKLQQELQAMKQRQDQLEKERMLEQQNQEREMERRRQQQVLNLRNKQRARESAIASTEVKQKLQEFLLNKSTKDPASSGSCIALSQSTNLWFTNSHHSSLEQNSPPLGGLSPSGKFPLPSLPDCRDDFPLRKTASEPNLKVRSRLKQKVAERRSSPLLKRKEGTVITPLKKRALELIESTSSSSPGSGSSSPNGVLLGLENGSSSQPCSTHTERWLSQPKLLGSEGSVSMLNLYTSPSLPNITLGLSAASSPINAGLGLKEKHCENGGLLSGRQGMPTQLLGPAHLSAGMDKVSSSQQVLLQHLLHKEQLRQQKILSNGQGVGPVHPPSPLAMKDRSSGSVRPKLPRHRPLNRTQSAPLPQSMLAQLVIQQQHQHFLEKQKQYQQQIQINKLLSKSIEQLRKPNGHLPESEEEEELQDHVMQEASSPPYGVIRKCSPNHSIRSSNSDSGSVRSDEAEAHIGVLQIKEEPVDSDEETHAKESLAEKQSIYLHQVEGRLVIRAMN